MTTSTKKRLGTLGLVFALCVSLLATFAFFTDRETQTSGGTAGNIDLVFTDISANATGTDKTNNSFAIDKVWENKALVSDGGVLNPGDYFDLSYTVSNTGSKSIDLKQQIVLTSTKPMTHAAEGDAADAAAEYTITVDGVTVVPTLTDITDGEGNATGSILTYEIPVITLNGSVEVEDGVEITAKTYSVQLNFDLDAANSFLGSSVTVDYNAQAKQHRNTTDDHWTDWAELETVGKIG